MTQATQGFDDRERQSDPPAPAKDPWRAPKLTVLGDAQALTGAGGAIPTNDGLSLFSS